MARRPAYLYSGELPVLTVRPHPIVLAKPFVFPWIATVLFAAFPHSLTVLILLVALGKFLWDAAFWWHDRYVLTNERMVSLEGIFTRRIVSMPLSKITDAIYERTLLGRVLGYGLLDLESAGQVGLEKIDYLPDPDIFYRAVMALALGKIDMKDLTQD